MPLGRFVGSLRARLRRNRNASALPGVITDRERAFAFPNDDPCARWIKYSPDDGVQGSHDADPGEHRRAAEIGDEYQRLNRGLPFRAAASFFGRPVMYVAASRSVRRFPPPERATGSSNSRPHPRLLMPPSLLVECDTSRSAAGEGDPDRSDCIWGRASRHHCGCRHARLPRACRDGPRRPQPVSSHWM